MNIIHRPPKKGWVGRAFIIEAVGDCPAVMDEVFARKLAEFVTYQLRTNEEYGALIMGRVENGIYYLEDLYPAKQKVSCGSWIYTEKRPDGCIGTIHRHPGNIDWSLQDRKLLVQYPINMVVKDTTTLKIATRGERLDSGDWVVNEWVYTIDFDFWADLEKSTEKPEPPKVAKVAEISKPRSPSGYYSKYGNNLDMDSQSLREQFYTRYANMWDDTNYD